MAGRKPHPWFRKGRGWFVQLNGKQVPLGVTDENAVAEAVEALKRLLGGKPPASVATFSAVVESYLESVSHRIKPETLAGYRKCLVWAVARYGMLTVLDPIAVEKAVAAVPHWSDSHRCNLLWLIQSAVRFGGRADFTLRRPAKESRGADVVISEATYQSLLRETTGDFHQVVRLLWSTGARPSELLGLSAAAIDFESGTATLRKHKTKHKGKQRVLYFSPAALDVLREQCRKYPDGPLFRGRYHEPLTGYKLLRRFLRLSEKLGVRICAYGFRHAACTRLLSAGVSDAQVAAMMGHASTSMIHKNYSHLSANGRLLRDVAARLDDAA